MGDGSVEAPHVSDTPEDLLEFWFADALSSPAAAEARIGLWFSEHAAFDAEIRSRFGALAERALRGECDAWRGAARPTLALVLALDQLPRNLYRGSARAFEGDSKARNAARAALVAGFDTQLAPLEAVFLYLPFEHSEEPADQERSVLLFERLVARAPTGLETAFERIADFARRHRDVIERFGRFPQRNAALGRASSSDERAYVDGSAQD
jgi:uncharacterized protein (DUF924 family)